MAQTKTKIIISALILFGLGSPVAAAELNESDYGPEYFYAISGIVSGQAAPGVQSVYVNGKKLVLDARLNFSTVVSLAKGEKYLSVTSLYLNLRFTRKYLVIRHPKIKKPFVVHVPKQEFQKMIEKKTSVRPRSRPIAPKKKVVRPFTKEKWLGFELVQELTPGKMFVIRKLDNKYFAALYVVKDRTWFPMNKLSLKDFKELLQ